ncbi:MAG: hypothetical protein JNL82_27765 [Myxococcales bacterium]|nr:hypothetical protein [Myxococcales bacterium]
MTTPIRDALVAQSTLRPLVEDGLQALKREHRAMVDAAIRGEFADSLELDEAMLKGNEQANRWDYLLGHESTGHIVGLEPHSAKNDEITTVIGKRRAALDQLRGHLKPSARVTHWFWVASGKVDFLPLDKAKIRLDNEGITFIGKTLQAKHLPRAGSTTSARRRK